jgi:hypothetical protein
MVRSELLFILLLETLEFWRFYLLKNIKMLHDEFLYDESLNSYHSHIYMHLYLLLVSIEYSQAVSTLRDWSCG